ncbi:glycosyltransferase family 2 protein [Nitrosomonas sp. PY1]|uniref:glycosyltransferase family 2 protein n=1 Tax=Nitrosomonas sp. PY1 TaxID=1803906 RepID=UPI001FC8DA5B|nr:glycosyltransferase family 2 protein [Nitrosomonas sp. PY1]
MDKASLLSVDVVIPVYNSPDIVKRCIDSVIAHLGQSIHKVWIQDDASNMETREMLDRLTYAQVHVHHAVKNLGYGQSVNEAVARSDADLVLVLNSDTELRENFLPTLCSALQQDEKLAVVSPIHDSFFRYHPSRYQRQSGGYIMTHRFQGYGFLVRRELFISMGGFDQQFGRGYYEDIDLGRRLIEQGWRLGIHADCYIYHKSGASFGRGEDFQALVARNRARYFLRYPDARENVLLISNQHLFLDLSPELVDNLNVVMQRGGSIYWLTPLPPPQLSCLQVHSAPVNLFSLFRLMLRGKSRADKRISAVWILEGVPWVWQILLRGFVRLNKLKLREWVN